MGLCSCVVMEPVEETRPCLDCVCFEYSHFAVCVTVNLISITSGSNTTSVHSWVLEGKDYGQAGFKRVIGILLHSSHTGLNTGLIAAYGKKSKA